MAILGPDWGAWEVVEHDIRMAREFGLVSSSHTRRREDCVVPDGYARMAKAGLLGPDHNLVHGTSYDTADLRVVVDSGASLTSTVLVELHHHIGDTMVAAFREQGGKPSIGIDVELYTTGQMFREMQAALLFARGKEVRNNALRGNSPLKTIPVRSREALEWATVNGATAFGLDGKIGTLTPGKKADIVMLRADDVNMTPVWDPIYSIVEIAGAGNVDTVIIDGVVRKQDGKLTFPADVLRRRIAELTESGARIMREGGYKVATGRMTRRTHSERARMRRMRIQDHGIVGSAFAAHGTRPGRQRSLQRKARAAAAGGLGLRIVDLERGADQVVDEVDLGAGQVLQRHRIDQHGDAVAGDDDVVVGLVAVDVELVLEAGAAAAHARSAAAWRRTARPAGFRRSAAPPARSW